MLPPAMQHFWNIRSPRNPGWSLAGAPARHRIKLRLERLDPGVGPGCRRLHGRPAHGREFPGHTSATNGFAALQAGWVAVPGTICRLGTTTCACSAVAPVFVGVKLSDETGFVPDATDCFTIQSLDWDWVPSQYVAFKSQPGEL